MRHIATVALLLAVFAAHGHEGEDHGAPPVTPTTRIDPRASASGEGFEVVAALEGGQLVVYLDRLATNEPVAGARLDIEGAGLKGVAREAAPGTYALDLAAPLAPARHALTIGVEVGDEVDLLAVTLDTAVAAATAEHVHTPGEWQVWGLAAALLAAAGMLGFGWRRKRAAKEA
ncbi:MAG: hypothetical protein MUC86_00465 [Burkholderiaceae bacterium]|jgi:hypothetical protein|nr:hypothetical protein [Burkholderiaceae bacterium]